MSKNLIYPAVVEKSPDGSGYSIYFPDLPGTVVVHSDIDDLIEESKVVMSTALMMILSVDHAELPKPSNPTDIKLNSSSDMIIYIATNLYYIEHGNNNSVPVNCTMPEWMRTSGKKRDLNFSFLLQKAVREALLD